MFISSWQPVGEDKEEAGVGFCVCVSVCAVFAFVEGTCKSRKQRQRRKKVLVSAHM